MLCRAFRCVYTKPNTQSISTCVTVHALLYDVHKFISITLKETPPAARSSSFTRMIYWQNATASCAESSLNAMIRQLASCICGICSSQIEHELVVVPQNGRMAFALQSLIVTNWKDTRRMILQSNACDFNVKHKCIVMYAEHTSKCMGYMFGNRMNMAIYVLSIQQQLCSVWLA